ncbi:MAG: autotransporter domain-containing protein [Rhizobiaceae bacterium]
MTEKIQSDCLVIGTIATPQPCKNVAKTLGDISTGANCEPTFHRLSLPHSLTQVAFTICLALFAILGGLPISHADAGEYVRSYGGTRAQGEVGARQWKRFEIEVEDDFVVEGGTMRVDLNLFAWNINAIDLRLTAPDGTRWKFLNNQCGGVALTFGGRGYDEFVPLDPSDSENTAFVNANYNPSPDWYGFSDTASHPNLVGNTNNNNPTLGFCRDIWQNPDPITPWPNGQSNPAHNLNLPWLHSNSGSWTKLPPNTFLGNVTSSFDAKYSGKQSEGTWILEVQEWLNHETYLHAAGPRTIPFVEDVKLTFITELADLSIEMSSDKTTDIVPGDTVTYTIDVTNLGSADVSAVNTISTLALPAGMTLESTSGCVNDSAVSLDCELGDISVGQSVQYSVVARTSTAVDADIVSTASVISDTLESIKSNNTTSSTVQKETARDVAERTQRVIKNFMARRADVIVSNEVDLTDRLTQREGKGQPLSGSFALAPGNSQANITMEPVTLGRLSLWGKTVWSASEDDSASNSSFLAYLGLDTLIREDTVIGVMAQIDRITEETASTSQDINGRGWQIEGYGWLAGPYVVTRLHQNLIFDGRAAYGQSNNTVEPYVGLHSDDFITNRWLATARLSGDFYVGDFRIMPSVRWNYFSEESENYIDSLGNPISSQDVSLGRVTFGPTISRMHNTEDDRIFETSLGVFGLWDYDGHDFVDVNSGFPTGYSSGDIRARVEAGFRLYDERGSSIKLTGHYDGLGVNDFEAFGGSVKFSVPLGGGAATSSYIMDVSGSVDSSGSNKSRDASR